METHEVLAAMRDWLETVELVPPDYAEYAPLVIDGLLHFLGNLPAERLGAILDEQLTLPEASGADERLIALLRQCPTLHKLGQVVARQAGLPLELRRRLQALESLVPVEGAYAIEEIIHAEVGEVPGLSIAPHALAEGSVAFVVPFVLREASGTRRGVFKALKPDAERRLLEDLAVWPELADFLVERSSALGLPALDLRALMLGVADLLRNEIQLAGEQARLERARRFYADCPDVVIPALFSFCTPRVTAMERIEGVKVTDASGTDRRALAQTIAAALLAKPFWSDPGARPFFHADPHAGNLFATADGKLAIFDWALTTELSEAQLAAVVRILLCAAVLDEPGIVRALATLGTVRSPGRVRDLVAEAVSEVRRGRFPGFSWLTPLLDRLARTAALAFPDQTALFRKALLTLTGVLRDVAPDASLDGVLLRRGARQFATDAWRRPLVALDSRAFGSHVSSADLVGFASSSSLVPARFWWGEYRAALARLTG